jgi:hypothetical protein
MPDVIVHGCWIEIGSSRVCEDGTKGCVREHAKVLVESARTRRCVVRHGVGRRCALETVDCVAVHDIVEIANLGDEEPWRF